MSLEQSIKTARNLAKILNSRMSNEDIEERRKSEAIWIDETINRLSSMLSSGYAVSRQIDSDCVKDAIHNFKTIKNEINEEIKGNKSYHYHCENNLLSKLSDIDFYIKRLSGKKKKEYSYHVINNEVDKADFILEYLKEKEISFIEDEKSKKLYFMAKKRNELPVKEMLLEDFGDNYSIVSVVENMGSAKRLKVLKDPIHKQLLGIY